MPEPGKKRIVRLDTGEEVAVKIMTDHDRQMVLDLQQKAEAEEAAKEPEKEPIITPPPVLTRIEAPMEAITPTEVVNGSTLASAAIAGTGTHQNKKRKRDRDADGSVE